jgi:GNAT superfamily N-acetyltransferase
MGMTNVFAPTALTAEDRESAAELLTEAFFDNPAHAFIYPDPATRRERLRWLMYANLGAQLELCRSFGEKDEPGAIAAMGFWHAPGAPKASAEMLARFGFLEMRILHGADAFARMSESVAELEERRTRCLSGRESWYLNNMVVARAYRGRGAGSRLLRRQLDEVVDPSGRPASLTTQRPENVVFYRRLGFEVADQDSVILGADSFPNWIMIYG